MRITTISLSPMSDAQKDRLRALGDLEYHEAVLGDPGIGELCRGAELLVTTPRLAVDIVPFLDGCRLISVQAAGTDALNIPAAREKGIVISNVPEFCTDAVAEHAFALMLTIAKRIPAGPPLLHAGAWDTALAYTTTGLSGKTLGLFGCGKIGSRIAEVALGFGMNVQATVRDPSKTRDITTVDFDTLVKQSDFIVLAAPATEQTIGIFDLDAFARMKREAVLINISRAALVNSVDLVAALDGGHLAFAATDVFSPEPPAADDPLLHHPKILVSPHVAWGTEDAVERLLDLSIANVEAFLNGKPINVVS